MNKAYIAHHIPGHRIRIRVPHKKHDTSFFHDVVTRLNTVDGVKAAATPTTGSVLVHYQGDYTDLLLKIAETGLATLLQLETGDEPIGTIGERLLDQASAVEQRLLTSTGGHVDGRSFVMLALLLATGVQIFRGQLFGPAVPLLWYTAETVRHYLPNRPR